MAEIDARRPNRGRRNRATPGTRQMRDEAIVSGAPDWVRTLVSRYDPDVRLEPGRRLGVELRASDWTTSGRERASA